VGDSLPVAVFFLPDGPSSPTFAHFLFSDDIFRGDLTLFVSDILFSRPAVFLLDRVFRLQKYLVVNR
jgi:hypothetical protein